MRGAGFLSIAGALALTIPGCSPAAPPAAQQEQQAPAPRAFPDGELVDLSHTYGRETIFWPTADPFRLDVVADGITPGGYYYASNNVFTSEHGGTHMDAPVHFGEGRQTADQVPLERLIAPVVVVDVTAKAEQDPDYQVSVGDLQAWEIQHSRIPADAVLLLRTGFSRRWPDAHRYLGTSERGDAGVKQLHFPGLHPDAAAWIVEERPVRAIGIDTASMDYGQSTLFETHRTLAAHDIPGFENLTALDRLPPTGATIIALPMKIGGGSGAPLRAVAIVPR